MNCSDADAPRFAGELFRHYRRPELVDADAAFALLDTVLSLPLDRVSAEDLHVLTGFFRLVAGRGRPASEGRRPAAVPPPADGPGPQWPGRRGHHCRRGGSGLPGKHAAAVSPGPPGRAAGPGCLIQRSLLDRQDAVSNVFLDNLKTATHWVLKAVGVEYLLDQVERGTAPTCSTSPPTSPT